MICGYSTAFVFFFFFYTEINTRPNAATQQVRVTKNINIIIYLFLYIFITSYDSNVCRGQTIPNYYCNTRERTHIRTLHRASTVFYDSDFQFLPAASRPVRRISSRDV